MVNSNNDLNNSGINNNFPAVGKEGAFYELRITIVSGNVDVDPSLPAEMIIDFTNTKTYEISPDNTICKGSTHIGYVFP